MDNPEDLNEPPNGLAKTGAKLIQLFAKELDLVQTGELLPTYEGGLGLSFSSEKLCITVECDNDGNTIFYYTGTNLRPNFVLFTVDRDMNWIREELKRVKTLLDESNQ